MLVISEICWGGISTPMARYLSEVLVLETGEDNGWSLGDQSSAKNQQIYRFKTPEKRSKITRSYFWKPIGFCCWK